MTKLVLRPWLQIDRNLADFGNEREGGGGEAGRNDGVGLQEQNTIDQSLNGREHLLIKRCLSDQTTVFLL